LPDFDRRNLVPIALVGREREAGRHALIHQRDPTTDEYGMFHARAAALRSAEPGRQVGAAVATEQGDIVSVGVNEVPKAGGGLYWCGDSPDGREFRSVQESGADLVESNYRQIKNLITETIKLLKNAG
jgi:cytidine deaminase